MMTTGPLSEALACMGLGSPASMAVLVRLARQAGLIGIAGRGSSAHRITEKEAATAVACAVASFFSASHQKAVALVASDSEWIEKVGDTMFGSGDLVVQHSLGGVLKITVSVSGDAIRALRQDVVGSG